MSISHLIADLKAAKECREAAELARRQKFNELAEAEARLNHAR